jgi:hypothetical protein
MRFDFCGVTPRSDNVASLISTATAIKPDFPAGR